jgi:UDP-N-acetylglucosamine--N-acetylmuramyl-(pentapeptide) pyrophosphoryl-undecaprenol N-acetylglucosamine transferase
MRRIKAIFAGGGTGGHLSPALAIANKLKSRLEPGFETEFIFVGTRRGLEYRIRDKLGFPLVLINIRGISRSLSLSNIAVPFLLVGALAKSIGLMIRFSPDIIVGTGGYVMGPVLMAASIMNKPRVIQEQNSYPGVTTRKLASKVDRVFLGFGSAKKYLNKKAHTIETGNPIKEVIGRIPKEEGRKYFDIDNNKKVILILGGSQGATAINRNILRSINELPEKFHLIWQTGERDYKEVAAQAGGKVFGRSLFPFTDCIEMAYAAADLVIARAGALTLAEIMAAGLPSILAPYPYAAGDHQRKNAESFVNSGASVMYDDSKLTNIALLSEAARLFDNGENDKMASACNAMRSKRDKSAVDMITDEILKLLNIGSASESRNGSTVKV